MHILLVEDDARLARSYRRNLEEEGHLVELASDGITALDRILEGVDDFEVIILDVLLPGRTGISVCREARHLGVKTPILILTALDQTEDKVLGLDAGADDYLTKPFPFDELLARLRALGRRSNRYSSDAGATTLQVADLKVDLLRHEVYRGDEFITLTAREFALLELLMRNAGQVLTRAQIIARIWSDGTDAGSNVLETYIHYLRDKIDRDASVKLIATVRGVGYSIRLPRGDEIS
jgi:two-component system copper resistance phosphate regulon response regulator CusR